MVDMSHNIFRSKIWGVINNLQHHDAYENLKNFHSDDQFFCHAEFGVGNLVPNYASFRSVGGDFTYGTNFAISGSSARNITGGWLPDEGFNVPFSLSLQMEWVERYKIHLMFYYFPSTSTPTIPLQKLPLQCIFYLHNLFLFHKIVRVNENKNIDQIDANICATFPRKKLLHGINEFDLAVSIITIFLM